ncbi:MAG: hypothetical protein LLG05_09835 [Porphyromonadaceae bacterium]|nr:hypothetical protein [Porphyromonadaceae bacterium]
MKFIIEVDEFWVDGDSDERLAVDLQKHITNALITEIYAKIKDKVDSSIAISVKTMIEKSLAEQINARIAECIQKETITVNKEEVLISDYLKEIFVNNTRWNNPKEQITELAKKFGNEMKKRYDFFYASKIVENMKTIGFIKEEVMNALIEHK